MVINIAICDDEEFYAKELCSRIKKYTKWDGHSYTLNIFSSGEQTSDAIRNGLKIDILFIDIKLDDSSLGTDIGAKLKISNPDMLVVYMSVYDSYYKELACAEPFDFIYKPDLHTKVPKVLDKAIMRIAYIKHEFVYQYKFNGILYRVNLNDVVYFESKHRVINIYCSDGTVRQFYEKLDNVEKDIDKIYPCFLRVNKSYFANFNYITRASGTTVMIGDMEMKLGRQYKESFSKKYDHIVLSWYA